MDLLQAVRGSTFDDFLFTPQKGVLPSRDPDAVDLSTRLTEHVALKRPIVSANMDTVTRAAMAIVMAEEGGIGVIDRGFRPGDIQPQVNEVTAVKRTQHGVITDPHTISPQQRIGEALRKMEQTRVGTLAVVDQERHLVGLLTERDTRFVRPEKLVSERMTTLGRLVVHTGEMSLIEAAQVMRDRKIKKLPLVDSDGKLLGLITAKDLLNHERHPFATRDSQGRLRVAAAIGATGDFLERADELLRAEADVLVLDIAHGHSQVMQHAVEELRKRFGNMELIAGNVATAEGVRFLLELGVNGIKVGIGPGAGCTTRLTTNFGVPQVEALVQCRMAAENRVPLIADGGVRRDGSIATALMFGGDWVSPGLALPAPKGPPAGWWMNTARSPERQKSCKCHSRFFAGWRRLPRCGTGSIWKRPTLANWKPSAPKGLRSAFRHEVRRARSFTIF